MSIKKEELEHYMLDELNSDLLELYKNPNDKEALNIFLHKLKTLDAQTLNAFCKAAKSMENQKKVKL